MELLDTPPPISSHACLGCGSVEGSTEYTSTLPSTGHSEAVTCLRLEVAGFKGMLSWKTSSVSDTGKQPRPSRPFCNDNKCSKQLHKFLLFLGPYDVEGS